MIEHRKCNEKQARHNRKCTESVIVLKTPFADMHVNQIFFVNMYYFRPILLAESNTANILLPKRDFLCISRFLFSFLGTIKSLRMVIIHKEAYAVLVKTTNRR